MRVRTVLGPWKQYIISHGSSLQQLRKPGNVLIPTLTFLSNFIHWRVITPSCYTPILSWYISQVLTWIHRCTLVPAILPMCKWRVFLQIALRNRCHQQSHPDLFHACSLAKPAIIYRLAILKHSRMLVWYLNLEFYVDPTFREYYSKV